MKPRLRYILYFIKNAWFVMLYKIFRKKKSINRFCGQKQVTISATDKMLKEMIETKEPFAAVRFGAVELSAINFNEKIILGFKRKYKKTVKYSMKNNAGFFPSDDFHLEQYGKMMKREMANIDMLGISGLHMEDYFYKNLCSQAKIGQYHAFEPIDRDWINALKNKKILIVSPFADEIRDQIEREVEPFGNELLKKLHISVVEAVQTIGDAKDSRFANWFEALDYMKMEILKIDFDIALIGAGAYGTPLCTFVKRIKKQAIQTGGATQLLFGIIGKRWETRDYVAKYITKEWIRPYHKPLNSDNVEKGCYW